MGLAPEWPCDPVEVQDSGVSNTVDVLEENMNMGLF